MGIVDARLKGRPFLTSCFSLTDSVMKMIGVDLHNCRLATILHLIPQAKESHLNSVTHSSK
ncbi:hypothetical protein YC2023_105702 [Brassica napus]